MKLLKTKIVTCAGLSVLLLVGCTSKIDDKAISAFGNSILEFQNVKFATYEFDMNVVVDKEEVKFLLDGAYDANKTLQAELNAIIESDGIKIPALKMNLNEYIVYMDMMGQKQAISLETFKPMLSILDKGTSSKKTFDEDDVEEMKESLDKASIKDGTVSLQFDANYIKDEIEKQNKEEFRDVLVESFTIDAVIKDKKMTSGKFTLKFKNADSTEDAKVVIKFKLKNMNKKVDIKEVTKDEYGVPVDAMQLLNDTVRKNKMQ